MPTEEIAGPVMLHDPARVTEGIEGIPRPPNASDFRLKAVKASSA